MSLLMDALKKAEKAKQGPNSVFGEPPAAAAGAGNNGPATEWPVLSIDPKPAELEAELGIGPVAEAPPPVAAKPPRVEQPAPALALDPLPPRTEARPTDPLPLADPEPAPARGRVEERAAGRANDASLAADRLAARGVFSAKRPGSSATGSRTPFYVVVGLLLLAGAGAGYYVWSEMQTPPSLTPKGPALSASGPINTAPLAATPPAGTQASAASPPVPNLAPQAPAGTPALPSTPASAQPADSTRAVVPPPPASPGTASPPVATVTPAPAQASTNLPAPRAQPQSAPPPARPASPSGREGVSAYGGAPVSAPSNLRITRDRPAPVDPAVNAGYAALAEGNLEAARASYNRALEADSTNRDALLGLAAVATRGGRGDVAENLYQRVLELHPRDPYATAQLTTLRNGGDAAVAESRVKALLANEREPVGAAPLHFALGNQMAAQGRWAEAQQAYFSAYSAEPDNPDYCFNLAVSLDQLRQPRLAHDFYAKAIESASKRRAGFDLARARARLEQLGAAAR